MSKSLPSAGPAGASRGSVEASNGQRPQSPAGAAFPPITKLISAHDFLTLEVQPLVRAHTLLARCMAVLHRLADQVEFERRNFNGQSQLDDVLRRACSTWDDPLMVGDELDVVRGLAQAVEFRTQDLADIGQVRVDQADRSTTGRAA
jgi:hypothetical protein